MKIRMAIAIAAAASNAAGPAAHPGNEQSGNYPKPVAAQPPVVLASAADVRPASPTPSDRSVEPARRPAPRVTTCRCGDPQPAEEQPDQ